MRRPSRSKIFPRGARIGMLRTRFCCARTSYSSLLRICRLHNPYDSPRNITSVTYCTAVNLVCGSFSLRSNMTAWSGLCQRNPYLEYNILACRMLGQRPEWGLRKIVDQLNETDPLAVSASSDSRSRANRGPLGRRERSEKDIHRFGRGSLRARLRNCLNSSTNSSSVTL